MTVEDRLVVLLRDAAAATPVTFHLSDVTGSSLRDRAAGPPRGARGPGPRLWYAAAAVLAVVGGFALWNRGDVRTVTSASTSTLSEEARSAPSVLIPEGARLARLPAVSPQILGEGAARYRSSLTDFEVGPPGPGLNPPTELPEGTRCIAVGNTVGCAVPPSIGDDNGSTFAQSDGLERAGHVIQGRSFLPDGPFAVWDGATRMLIIADLPADAAVAVVTRGDAEFSTEVVDGVAVVGLTGAATTRVRALNESGTEVSVLEFTLPDSFVTESE